MKEIITLIDESFNAIKDRKQRFIYGESNGGYIALHNALKHQNIFSKAGGYMILKKKGINFQNHIFLGNHSVKYIQSNIENI